MAAVRGDQIFPAQLARFAAIDFLHADGDAIGVLPHRGHFRALHDRCPGFTGPCTQYGLEAGLVQVQTAAWAQRFDAFVQSRHDVRQLAAGQTSIATIAPSGTKSSAERSRTHLSIPSERNISSVRM